MLCILLVIEFSLVSSHIFTSEDDAERRYSDDFNQLTNEILLYMKRTQYTKPWGPSWTLTPVYTLEGVGRNRGSSMLFPGQRPESDIDTEIEDYKQGLDPTYQKKTRASKLTSGVQPVTTLSTSTMTVTTESTSTLTTTTTTESPIAHELNEYIDNKHVGMFSAFTVKFMKIITEKKPSEVKPLFDVFGQYVDAILRDGRVNRLPDQDMALEVLQYLESLNIFLKYGKPEDLQLRAALFLKLVEDQHEDVLKNDYSVYYFVDKYFDSDDAPGMLKAIQDIGEYPGNGMSASHVASELMAIALLPLQRLAGRQGYGGIKQRAHTDVSISNPKENIIDINEAKVLKNDWNYNKDSNFGLFGNTKSNFNSLNGVTNSVEHVRSADNFVNINNDRFTDTEKSKVNRGIFKSKMMDGKNDITNHSYSKENFKNRHSINNGREDVIESNKVFKDTKVGKELKDKEANKINRRKFTSDSRIIQENEKDKGRRKMLHDLEQDKRKSIMKKENKYRQEKCNHRLRYNSHKSSIKTETYRNKRKMFKKSEDITKHKTIRSNEIFLTTRNTRKDNRIEKTNKSKIKEKTSRKISIGAIKEKLFDLLKRKDARKFFTTTTKKGLSLVSSESDEEIELRKNIYKAIGVHNDFVKVKAK